MVSSLQVVLSDCFRHRLLFQGIEYCFHPLIQIHNTIHNLRSANTPLKWNFYILLFGRISRVEVYMMEDDLWMKQASLAKLFQSSTQNITMHIRHIYGEDELYESSTCKLNLQVQNEGGKEATCKYFLQAQKPKASQRGLKKCFIFGEDTVVEFVRYSSCKKG